MSDLETEPPAHKLRLIRSPVVYIKTAPSQDSSRATTFEREPTGPDLEALGFRDGPNHDCPELARHEEATSIEVWSRYASGG